MWAKSPSPHTTSLYNEALASVLPQNIRISIVVPRKEAQGAAISASHVRELIKQGDMEALRPLVPETTYAYLTGPLGQKAIARIQAAGDVRHH